MTEPDESNTAYRLKLAADRAYAEAEVTLDRGLHAVKNAMTSAVVASEYALERAAHDKAHGVPEQASLPSWPEVCPDGNTEAGPYTPTD
jgi:hypothetical protein